MVLHQGTPPVLLMVTLLTALPFNTRTSVKPAADLPRRLGAAAIRAGFRMERAAFRPNGLREYGNDNHPHRPKFYSRSSAAPTSGIAYVERWQSRSWSAWCENGSIKNVCPGISDLGGSVTDMLV